MVEFTNPNRTVRSKVQHSAAELGRRMGSSDGGAGVVILVFGGLFAVTLLLALFGMLPAP